MLKSIALLAIVGVAGYMGYKYYTQKKQAGCGCEDEVVEEKISAPAIANEVPPADALQKYNASPRETLSTPARLLINTAWPTDGSQEIAKS